MIDALFDPGRPIEGRSGPCAAQVVRRGDPRAVSETCLMQGVEEVAREGYAIVPGWLDMAMLAALRGRLLAHERAGELRPAEVGRGRGRVGRSDIRGDRILWLGSEANDAAEAGLRARLEALRLAINRETMLGLFDFEGHYAVYPPGAAYARHRDRFRDDDRRVVSCVAYLNEAWSADDGGALRLHLDDGIFRDVSPMGGTLVIFLSDRFEHEVLPASRPRMTITGWFRRRATHGI